jgi:hypothetical protein
MLAGLQTAFHVTGKDRYRLAYHMLIDRYHYDDEAIVAKLLFPKEWTVPWDDHLAAKSFYSLFRYETDPNLLQKYRMSLNRHWFAWKDSELSRPEDIFYWMLYQLFTGEKVVDEKCTNAIKNMWGFDRNHRVFTIPTEQGPKQVEADEEGDATGIIGAYWFGRHYGFIDPAW